MTGEMNEIERRAQEWARLRAESSKREERPYRECPNCGLYKFRAIRWYEGGLLTAKKTKYVERCANCKYKGSEIESK